jgi:hypothetical protein
VVPTPQSPGAGTVVKLHTDELAPVPQALIERARQS